MLQHLHLYKVVWKDWRIITRMNYRKGLLSRGSENRKQMSSGGRDIKQRKNCPCFCKKRKTNMCNYILFMEEIKNYTVYFKLQFWKKMLYNLGHELIRVQQLWTIIMIKVLRKSIIMIKVLRKTFSKHILHCKRVTEDMMYSKLEDRNQSI